MQNSDLLLYNGTFITMNSAMPHATALAIKGERITWVGNQQDRSSWMGKNTQLIDLKGAYVYPGFIDTHAHIIYTGIVKNYLQLEGKDKTTILAEVQKHAEKQPKGEWIIGVGWDESIWPEKILPHASELDKVAPHHPVMLQRVDTHSIWVNNYALNLGGINAQTPDPSGGKIERGNSAKPTGILVDTATRLITNKMPYPNVEDRMQLAQKVLQQCLANGITMVHDAAISEIDYEAFRRLSDENLLNVRIYMMGTVRDREANVFLSQGPQIYSPFLELRCLKIWMDGALGSRGAALFESYDDDPTNKGLLLWEEKDLIPILQQAKAKGFQCAIHGIGDKANHAILNAYEKIEVEGLRWRIEHAQLLVPSDITRLAKMKVIVAMQPLHALVDMPWLKDRIGTIRSKTEAFIWRSLLNHGIMIVGGSDAPVVDLNPLLGIYAAITRQDYHGYPQEGWYPEQKMTREEALKIYTLHAAHACFREHELGSLEPNKLADLVVLPENLLTCPPKAMLNMQVIYTLVNGKIRFQL